MKNTLESKDVTSIASKEPSTTSVPVDNQETESVFKLKDLVKIVMDLDQNVLDEDGVGRRVLRFFGGALDLQETFHFLRLLISGDA
ncbi:hypothetical protein Tco_0761484 [Tanacetum coccineum]